MKRLRIYLDTNIIYGFIKEMAKAELEGREYNKTRKIVFLQGNLDKLEPVTSFFSFMEVVDSLNRELEISKTMITNAIFLFKKFSGIKIIDKIVLTGEAYKWLLSGISLKDSIQVNIAKNEGFAFISEDKKLIRRIKIFYGNSMTLSELKEILYKSK